MKRGDPECFYEIQRAFIYQYTGFPEKMERANACLSILMEDPRWWNWNTLNKFWVCCDESFSNAFANERPYQRYTCSNVRRDSQDNSMEIMSCSAQAVIYNWRSEENKNKKRGATKTCAASQIDDVVSLVCIGTCQTVNWDVIRAWKRAGESLDLVALKESSSNEYLKEKLVKQDWGSLMGKRTI